MPVDGITRVVHADLPAMLIGGLASLLMQMNHPGAMAGVAQHSRYQDDPLGRMLQTANFIGFTTYGTKATAAAAIERVLAVHEAVRGVANVPPEIVKIWNEAAQKILADPEYKKAYGAESLIPNYLAHDQYGPFIGKFATDTGNFLKASGVIR